MKLIERIKVGEVTSLTFKQESGAVVWFTDRAVPIKLTVEQFLYEMREDILTEEVLSKLAEWMNTHCNVVGADPTEPPLPLPISGANKTKAV